MTEIERSPAKAALLDRLRSGQAGASDRRWPAPARCRIPLTWGQEQIWLACQVTPDVPVYNEAVTLQRTGPCDVDALVTRFNFVLAATTRGAPRSRWSTGVPYQRRRPARRPRRSRSTI